MAGVSTRELLLIVRAQNQASGALRRIAGDVRAMGKMNTLQARREQMLVNERNLARQLQRIDRERTSITSGRRFQEQQRSMESALRREKNLRSDIIRQIGRTHIRQEELVRTMRAHGAESLKAAKASQLLGNAIASQVKMRSALAAMPAEIASISAAMDNNRRRLSELGAEYDSVRASQRLLATHMRDLNGVIRQQRWDGVARGMRTIGHSGRVVQMGGLVAGAGLYYAAKAAADFERRATVVATQTGKIGTGMGVVVKNAQFLSKSMLKLMPDSIATVEDMNNAAYDLFSTLDTLSDSQRGLAKGMEIMRVTSDASIGGLTDMETAMNGLVTAMTNFPEIERSAKGARDTFNTMFAAVRFGRVTFAEFAKALEQTAPAANAVGMSFEDMSANVAFLSKPLGIAKAAVGFARLTEILTRGKMGDALKKMNVNILDSQGHLRSLDEVTRILVKRFPELGKGVGETNRWFKKMAGTEGTIQARRAFNALITGADDARRTVQKVRGALTEYERSVESVSRTPMVRFEKAVNRIRALFLELGLAAIPALEGIIGPIGDLVRWFQSLSNETRKQIGTWTVYIATIALVGGTIAAVVGGIGSFVALLGRAGLLLPSFVIAIIAASAAIRALTGNFDMLGDVASAVMDQLTGSWEGFIVGAGLAVAALFKVRNAVIATRTMAAGAGTAGAAGGLLPMIIGSPRAIGNSMKTLSRFNSALKTQKVSMFARAMKLAGAAAVMLPGPLKLAAAGVGAFAIAAGIWKLHADAAKQKADELKASITGLAGALAQPQIFAKAAGGFADAFKNFRLAKLDLKDTEIAIAQLKQQLTSAKGLERASLINQLERLRLTRADQIATITQATGNLVRTFGDYARAIENVRQLDDQMEGSEGRIISLQRERARLQKQLARGRAGDPRGLGPGMSLKDMVALEQAIAGVNAKIKATKAVAIAVAKANDAAMTSLRRSFDQTVTSLQRMGIIPQITKKMREEIFKVTQIMGRQLTLKEWKLIVAAELDPSALKKLPAQLRRYIKEVRIQVKIDTRKAREDAQKQIRSGGLGAKDVIEQRVQAVKGEETAKQQKKIMNSVFSKAIHQKVAVDAPPATELVALGQNIVAGIQAGMNPVNQYVNIVETTRKVIVREFDKAFETGSPSKVMARLVGKPIVQGIIKGMQDETPKLLDEAKLEVRLLSGTYLEARRQLIQDNVRQIKDLGKAVRDKQREINQKQDQMDTTEERIALAKKKKRSTGSLKITLADQKEEFNRLIKERRALNKQLAKAQLEPTAVTPKDLIKDIKKQFQAFKQFNIAIAKIGKTAPAAFVEGLKDLGPDSLQFIKMLAKHKPILKEYVKFWKLSMKEVKKSALDTFRDIVRSGNLEKLAEIIEAGAQKLLSVYNEWRSVFEGFTDLFTTDALTDKLIQDFPEALRTWQEELDSLKDELADAYKELADLQKGESDKLADATREAIDNLQSAFGDLFSGDWLSGDEMAFKREWGIAISMQDLIKDLEGQLVNFKAWRANLKSLAARVPKELIEELEKLGPAGAEMIGILAGATDAEIAEYVRIWKEGKTAIQNEVGTILTNAEEFAKAITEIMNKINELIGKIAELEASKPSENPITPEDILKDITEISGGMTEFTGILEGLRDRGVPEELIQQIARMGPAALPYLRALISMTGPQLAEYVGLWSKMQTDIDTATRGMLDGQIALWRKHGNDIALAIMAGVMDEQEPLLNFFRNLFADMLGGAAGGAGGAPLPIVNQRTAEAAADYYAGTPQPPSNWNPNPLPTAPGPVIAPGGGQSFQWGGQTWTKNELAAFRGWLSNHGSSYKQWASNHMDTVQKMGWPAMARGGIVKKPMLAVVGEKGPETVLPFDIRTMRPKQNVARFTRTQGGTAASGSNGGPNIVVYAQHSESLMDTLERARFRFKARAN